MSQFQFITHKPDYIKDMPVWTELEKQRVLEILGGFGYANNPESTGNNPFRFIKTGSLYLYKRASWKWPYSADSIGQLLWFLEFYLAGDLDVDIYRDGI